MERVIHEDSMPVLYLSLDNPLLRSRALPPTAFSPALVKKSGNEFALFSTTLAFLAALEVVREFPGAFPRSDSMDVILLSTWISAGGLPRDFAGCRSTN